MRTALRMGLVLILVSSSVQAWGAESSGAALTIFSFDNVTVPFTHNLYLTMVPATKYPGNPVLNHGPEGSPDAQEAQFYGSIIKVDGKHRMWYCAESDPWPDNHHAPSFRPAYAESVDGIHWTKPKLGLVEFHGSKDNNLLQFVPTPHFDVTEPLASFVLYEPFDPNPAHRYKMPLYGCFFDSNDPEHKHRSSTIYPYFSADGLRWTLATSPPVDDGYNEQEAPIEGDSWYEIGGFYKFGGLYYVAGQGGILMADGKPAGRTMITHWSNDFVHWSQDRALSFVRYGYRSKEENLNEAHEPAAVWNRNNVLLAVYGLWQGSKDRESLRMPLGLLISNDGIHFREPEPDFELLSPGATGEWDQHGLIHGQGFENVGDQTYVYYGTWDLSILPDRHTGVGLSTLRRDGFGYLAVRAPSSVSGSRDASDWDASFTTIPLTFPRGGKAIRVNATGLGPQAHLRLELLDSLGNGVPGYSGAKASIIDRDGLAGPVRWANGRLPDGSGPYRLRIQFEGTDRKKIHFYSAYVE